MKYIFKAIKDGVNPLLRKPPFKSLDPNIHTLKKLIPDHKVIKKQNNKDFEDYIDGIFSQNPHLSEQEMYSVYHTHKPVFDKVKAEEVKNIKFKKLFIDLENNKEKLSKTSDKELFGKLFDNHLKLARKINNLHNK